MKTTFATYEHSTLGFSGVVLKWSETNGLWDKAARVVVNNVITQEWNWYNQHPEPFKTSEMERFDKWVRMVYSNNPAVQG